MVATALNPGERFSALDGMHVLFVPTIAAGSGIPTRLEINAGTDLTTEIEGWEGFDKDPQEIETPGLSRHVGTIPGLVKINSGLLRFYADRDGDDVRDVLPDGTTGGIVFMDNGDVPTKLMDIWPVRVNNLSKVRSIEAATLLAVKFSHPRLPVFDAAIPAAV